MKPSESNENVAAQYSDLVTALMELLITQAKDPLAALVALRIARSGVVRVGHLSEMPDVVAHAEVIADKLAQAYEFHLADPTELAS